MAELYRYNVLSRWFGRRGPLDPARLFALTAEPGRALAHSITVIHQEVGELESPEGRVMVCDRRPSVESATGCLAGPQALAAMHAPSAPLLDRLAAFGETERSTWCSANQQSGALNHQAGDTHRLVDRIVNGECEEPDMAWQ
jgi:hypothetical protein